MIRALLAGQKTVTRRVLKRQPEAPRCIYDCDGADTVVTPSYYESTLGTVVQFSWAMTRLNQIAAPFVDSPTDQWRCPFGGVGDRLWVRETWSPDSSHDPDDTVYRADKSDEWLREYDGCVKWRPSIFMPRHRSRLSLEIVDVRVERLHAITAEDAASEGVAAWWESLTYEASKPVGALWTEIAVQRGWEKTAPDYRGLFGALWCQINGRASWDANHFVWRIECRKVSS